MIDRKTFSIRLLPEIYKIIIFDNKAVASGSYNFSNNSENKSMENLTISRKRDKAQHFIDAICLVSRKELPIKVALSFLSFSSFYLFFCKWRK